MRTRPTALLLAAQPTQAGSSCLSTAAVAADRAAALLVPLPSPRIGVPAATHHHGVPGGGQVGVPSACGVVGDEYQVDVTSSVTGSGGWCAYRTLSARLSPDRPPATDAGVTTTATTATASRRRLVFATARARGGPVRSVMFAQAVGMARGAQ